jgi:deoxyxylulose-5-phosphate synthase
MAKKWFAWVVVVLVAVLPAVGCGRREPAAQGQKKTAVVISTLNNPWFVVRKDGAAYKVYTLLGDGELAEGSNWEAMLTAAHYRLDHLVAIVEVGIAEQNLVGVAAGLAAAGKTVYVVSPASFLTARALEQIKNDVCYSDRPVKLVGISAGVSYGALGATHHSTHDLAVLRAIENITIITPADNLETAQAIKAAAAMEHPVYLRFGKRPVPHLHPSRGLAQTARALLGI